MAKESNSRFLAACLSVFAVLEMTGAALAGSPCTDKYPPIEYRYEPSQPYTVERIPRYMLKWTCGEGAMFACAYPDTNEIFITDDVPKPEWLACLLTHEKAHLNGWRHPPRNAFGY